MKIQYG
ncbi:Protein of unknown function [Bacillus cereus]|nr:Protein of unknown function [Bacillus cereus]